MTKGPYALACLIAVIIPSAATATTMVPRTIVPGKILAPSSKAPWELRGTFEIRDPLPGEPYIQSSGGGGATMVAQFPVTVQICSATLPPCPSHPAAVRSHCLYENRTDATGTCWIRPRQKLDDGNPSNLRVQGPGDFTVPAKRAAISIIAQPDRFDARSFASLTEVTKWRLLSCLNGLPGSCSRGGEIDGKTILRVVGPITHIPLHVIDSPKRWPAFPIRFTPLGWLIIATVAGALAFAVVRLRIGLRKS